MSTRSGPVAWLPAILLTTALVVGYILVSLATLSTFPRVWIDEAWYVQPAWSFATEGTFALPMFDDLAGVDRDNVVMGRIYLLLMSVAIWIGDLGVTPVRAVSFVSGLVAIAAVFGVGQELWNRRVGVLAAILLAVAPNFVRQSHDARPEMMLVAFWTTALFLTLSGDRQGSRWRLVAGGLIAGLGADTHFNGVIFPVALFVVLLVRRATLRTIAFYSVGVVLAGLWWLWLHVLQDPALFREQLDMFGVPMPIFEILERPLQVFALEAARYAFVQPQASVVLLWLAVLAAVVLLRHHRDSAVLSLLALAGTVFVFMALVVGTRAPWYAVILWPVCALLVGRLVDVSPNRVGWGLMGIVVVVSIAATAWQVWPRSEWSYEDHVARLREVVPADATVQGDPALWFGFVDQPFLASHYFIFTDAYEENAARLAIDYVILDRAASGTCSWCASYPEEVAAFLDEHAELVAEVDADGFVSQVYRISG